MSYLRNAWYVACWSDEVKQGEMLSRTLLGEPVVFYRLTDGTPVALQDRCPHRFIPLHLGTIKNDAIECCYHGLQFDCTGACVKNPHGDGKIPSAARVRKYPVADRHGMLWIWMGDDKEDPSLITDYSVLDEQSGYKTSRGKIMIDANYELVAENLLDLSHAPFLHEGLLGTPEMVAAAPVVREEGNTLHVDRWMPNVSVPATFDMVFRCDGKKVDNWQNMIWYPPACFILDVGVHAPGESRDRGAWFYGIHILTPETDRTTHYHFAAAYPPGSPVIDAETNARLGEMRRIAFEEQDKPILNAQQAAIGDQDFWSMKPVLLNVDAGPVRMRRKLAQLIEQESRRDAVKRVDAQASIASPGGASPRAAQPSI
ncbi:aromatic ring-hydroxylating dioxygenase subunit alpha [Burkholderia anthina]|uniref:aromatic ring-hydroxylating dioxygenase subunit alpha n=1 Tax=Burkholderia anthina TaxID=179879 RepID=UPI00158AA968|nr:aromatic ring-hydroxylating dioxygenase subunit alpha [Burkholderia anthina]